MGQNSWKNLLVLSLTLIGYIIAKYSIKCSNCSCWKGTNRASRFRTTMSNSFYYSFFLRIWVENYLDIALVNLLRLNGANSFDNWFE